MKIVISTLGMPSIPSDFLHHVIARGTEHGKVFCDVEDFCHKNCNFTMNVFSMILGSWLYAIWLQRRNLSIQARILSIF